ncbi:MAG: lycopene beta-cyclase CrtY [Luteimonas sp.]
MGTDPDIILVGGGLANALIALRLRSIRPDLRVRMLERAAHPCGHHTWSFHASDLTPAQHEWIAPLVRHCWPAYSVRFPKRRRRLEGGYASIVSEDLAEALRAALGDALQCNADVAAIAPDRVTLADGRVLHARAVIDGRGARRSTHVALGFQAFLGRVVRTSRPHGLDVPMIMDADVPQGHGYRFVYVLPFSADTLLIEDTHYIDHDRPDLEVLGRNIDDYARARGFRIIEQLREEHGVLPIVLAGDFDRFWDADAAQPRSGLAAGLFHATTGYSLPHAVRLADRIAASEVFDAAHLHTLTRAAARTSWHRQSYFRLLNRMLFMAGRPEHRWRVMQRFYGLPERLIARFYADRLTLLDKLRIVAGKPPVPVGEAWRAVRADPAHARSSR